jgi:hypothetical protein
MKKSIYILLISLVFIFLSCTQLNTQTFYIEGYVKDDWGDGELHEWSSPFVVGAFQNGEVKGYDIGNEGDTQNDYFKIENLKPGEYLLKVFTNYTVGQDVTQLWNSTPDATKHINLTKNASITILFGEDE